MKLPRLSLLFLATAVLPYKALGACSLTLTNLVVFGDSYSDESRAGYIVTHNGSSPPPGLLLPPSNATATGGYTWTRLVANITGAKLFNYAVQGAAISNELTPRFEPAFGGPIPSVLNYEVPAFLADVAFVNKSTGTNTLFVDRTPNNTVYALWIGVNDIGVHGFFDASQVGSISYSGQTNVNTLRNYTELHFKVFDMLYAAGGRNFVLMNVPSLQLSPLYGIPPPLGGGIGNNMYWTNKKESNITDVAFKMLQYTTLVNTIFDYQVPFEISIARRYPGASISNFDVNALINDIYNSPTAFFPDEQGQKFNVTGFYRVCNFTGGDCVYSAAPYDTFLWYDPLHPTQATMSIVAKEFVGVVAGTSKYGKHFEG